LCSKSCALISLFDKKVAFKLLIAVKVLRK
jgi:hypothetical protein